MSEPGMSGRPAMPEAGPEMRLLLRAAALHGAAAAGRAVGAGAPLEHSGEATGADAERAGATAADRSGGLLSGKPDPDSLIIFAREHGMAGILCANLRRVLSDAGIEPSVELVERLEEEADRQAAVSLAVCSDMFRAMDELRRCGIEAMAFKGPALSVQAYGDAAVRSFSDVDILVRRRDAVSAIAALHSAGWESRSLPPRRLWEAFVRHHAEVQTLSPGTGTAVDLHWEAVPGLSKRPELEEGLWRNSKEVAAAGRATRTLSIEDHLVVLCAHGSKHSWGRLGWTCDALAMARRIGEDRWPALLEKARSAGCLRMLLWGVAMCESLFGLEVPEVMAAECRRDGRLPALVAGAAAILARGETPGWMETARLYCRSMDDTRDRLAFWLGAVFRPTEYEWRLISLPPGLFWIYSVIRPARLALKYAGSPFSGGKRPRRQRT
ncbi:MAG: nucleotidyltransferase family protein [Planctomycetota bacterium]|nr:nucleotidyltransferase family protein [Planctomycetota bacterium]